MTVNPPPPWGAHNVPSWSTAAMVCSIPAGGAPLNEAGR